MSDDDSFEGTECARCDREYPEERVSPVVINDDHMLCEGCRDNIEERIENYYWYDRFDKEQHERAVEILEDQDEILCAHGRHWQAGEIIVHTNYVSSAVISDVCDHFGFEIVGFGPRWQEEEVWEDCVGEMGSCFEIVLDYTSESPPPLPMEAEFNPIDIEWLDGNDKQFEAEK